jgi:pimeloyl-ACP methyl ester carboxylesterase
VVSSSEVAFTTAANVIAGWKDGEGPPVVILHGGPGLSDYTASLADELVDGYTVYRYQQRGLAPSSIEGPFTVDAHMSDMIAVLEAIGENRVWLVGHSWGGHLALHFAGAHPDHLLGLVVVDPLGVLGDGGESDMEVRMAERMSPESAARLYELDEKAMRGEGQPGDALEAFSIVWPTYFADPENAPAMPPIEMSLRCYSETFASIREEMARQSLPTLLHRVSVPSVFVLGGDSPMPIHHGELSAALIPGASIEIAEGCGHFPWLERPGVVRVALDSIAGS